MSLIIINKIDITYSEPFYRVLRNACGDLNFSIADYQIASIHAAIVKFLHQIKYDSISLVGFYLSSDLLNFNFVANTERWAINLQFTDNSYQKYTADWQRVEDI
jgi:hypothetical protein